MSVAAPQHSLPAVARPTSPLQRNINLTRELAFTNFKLKYTGSALGYMWSLAKPLMLFAIMYAVFARLLRVGKGTPEFEVQLLVAIVLWNFFTEATMTAMNSVASAGNLIRKAYFPRWILVLGSTLTAMMTLLINTCLVILITVPIGHMHLTLRSLIAPVFIVELLALIFGLSLLLSSLFVFYRDIGHIWEIITLVLFYGSAVVYPFTVFPGALRTFAGINPITQIIQDVRAALVDPGIQPTVHYLGALYAIPFAFVALVLVVGIVVFTRLTPRFAESL